RELPQDAVGDRAQYARAALNDGRQILEPQAGFDVFDEIPLGSAPNRFEKVLRIVRDTPMRRTCAQVYLDHRRSATLRAVAPARAASSRSPAPATIVSGAIQCSMCSC